MGLTRVSALRSEGPLRHPVFSGMGDTASNFALQRANGSLATGEDILGMIDGEKGLPAVPPEDSRAFQITSFALPPPAAGYTPGWRRRPRGRSPGSRRKGHSWAVVLVRVVGGMARRMDSVGRNVEVQGFHQVAVIAHTQEAHRHLLER